MVRFGILVSALFFGLAGCTSNAGTGNLVVPDGTYDLSFEDGSCGLLKTSSPVRYEADFNCDGNAEYKNTNITHIGNRYFVEAGSFEVTSVSESGFKGVFSLRGNTTPFTATLRKVEG